MLKELLKAQENAIILFEEVEKRKYIIPGLTEKELNQRIFKLAEEMFGIRKYWHKRIVRAGKNTLFPYKENPPNLVIKDDDILFFDFGPVFEDWEADLGRTYVLGNDPLKHKLKEDVEAAWHLGKEYFDKNKKSITGSEFYSYSESLACSFGWTYGGPHCGHLIGNFPHENIDTEIVDNYLHPLNNTLLSKPDKFKGERYWIYEIHFINKKKEVGGFFEQLVSAEK